ncbi:MAG: energy transducer TonB [Bacteroidota bacterium]
MNLFSFSKNDLDEVVFEHRNKQYGAYALRKSYDGHLLKATASSFGLLLLFGSTFYLASLFSKQVEPLVESFGKELSFDNNLSKKIEIVPDEQLLTKLAVKNTDNGHYRIMKDPLVNQRLTTPTNPTLPLNPVGTDPQPVPGIEPGIIGGTGTLPAAPIIEVKTPVATFATEMPSFEGGAEAMANFIRHTLVYPPDAMEYGKEGKVLVSFVVQTDGSITDIEVIKGFGFGSEEAAQKVIERMPKWIPGKQNGRLLPVKLILPLHFQSH